MNTIYKVIWNASLGIWIAVSELARGRIKSKNINNERVDCLKKNNFRRIIVWGLLSVFITPTYAVRTITISGTSGDLVSPDSKGTDLNAQNYTSWTNPNSPTADLGTSTGIGVIIGNGSSTTGGGNTIYGNNNKSISSNTIIFGNGNYSSATNGLTIGHRSSTAGNAAIAIGRDTVANQNFTVAIGVVTSATGVKAMAIGHSAEASGTNSIAFGASQGTGSAHTTTGARASGNYAIAIGTNVEASGQDGVAVGSNAIASALHSASFGRAANALAEKSLALGDAVSASGVRSLAMGASANATHDNSVALGSNSTTATNATSEISVTQNNLIYGNFQGQVSGSGMQVSVGSVGAERQIKNVAAGKISNTSTDAINGSQLFATNAVLGAVANSTKTLLGGNVTLSSAGTLNITNIGGTGATTVHDALIAIKASADNANTALANHTAAALGGGATYDAETGTWTPPTYTLINPITGTESTVSDIGSAISGLDVAVNTPLTFKDATTGISVNKLGSEFKFIGDANIAAIVTEGQLALSLNKNLTGLTSVQTTDGTNTTVYGANGLNINDGTVVLDSSGLNVGGVTVGSTGINANNQSISNVADAQNAGDATNLGQVESLLADATTSITNKGFSLQAEDGQTVTKKLGEAIEIVGDNKNISTEMKDDKLSVVLAKDLVLDSINAGGTILDSQGLTVGNTQVTSDGIFIAGGPSLSTSGIDAGNKAISNVSRGINANDAINKEQFDEAIQDLTDSVGGLAESAVQYDRNEDGSVNKDIMTLGGKNGTLITNVADGDVSIGSKDAVNGGQLATVRDNLQGQITTNTTQITELKNGLEAGTIGLVQQASPSDQISVAKNSGGTTVNFAGTSGNRVLTGIQSGSINKDSSDAITGAQLNANYEALAKTLGGNAKFENGEWTGPSYTVGYGENEKTVNNVGDAVSALNDANSALTTRMDTMGAQFDDAIKSTNERLDKFTNKTNAAVAAAIAIASLPQPTEYGNTMMAVGTGVWEGETGFSIGASGVTKESRILNASKPVHYVWKFATTTNSRGTWGGGASVGIQWK